MAKQSKVSHSPFKKKSNYLAGDMDILQKEKLLVICLYFLISGCSEDRQISRLTVVNGKGSGRYEPGSIIRVESDPPPEGLIFSTWIGDTVLLEAPKLSVANCTIPFYDATLTATYSTIPDGDPDVISFKLAVAPIIQLRCGGCHGAEDNLPLSTWQEIASNAADIQRAIETGFMPPGNPLLETEKDIVIRWIEQGKKNN
jgi:hypothetical protein